MILIAIQYKNKFFTEFEEVKIKNGYGGHGVGVGNWKELKPIFKKEPTYFTKRSLGDKISLILKAMNDNLIEYNNLNLIIKK